MKFSRIAAATFLAIAALLCCALPGAMAQDELFKALTGVQKAKLEPGKSGDPIAKLVGANRKSADLKYLDQRLAAVDAALANAPSAEKLANRANAQGLTPLAFAIYSGDGPIVVDALLEAGADPNAPIFNAPPIWHALALDDANSTQIALQLLDYGADPNATTKAGETPLHRAASTGNFWAAQRLLENGAKLDAVYNGKKALELAKDAKIKELLANWNKKPYPYAPLDPKLAPLQRAASQNNYYAVKRLLEKLDDDVVKKLQPRASSLTTDPNVRKLLAAREGGGKVDSTLYFAKKRAEHIFRGEYEKGNRHASGGHSYAAYLYMRGANLKPKTHAWYSNGVQVCSVERRSARRTADDPANPQHTFFPSNWSKGDVFAAVNGIARQGLKQAKEADSTRLEEDVNGVKIVVILRANSRDGVDIVTAYPLYVRQPNPNGRGVERLDDAKENVGDEE
ncbi:MAG: EndoU domain-containing protein [Thermoguttaceae bacterium]|nr:EndoU domain-containing protein [Thermoguttaceae bacterium]